MKQKKAHRRHDLSTSTWRLLKDHLPGRKGAWGRRARNNRCFLNAVFWIIRTGSPWRDLPPDYGDWKNTHRRFCRWRDKGIWGKLLSLLTQDPDHKWLMIDATHVKVHPDGSGAKGGSQEMGRTKGGSTAKCISRWMPRECLLQLLSPQEQPPIAVKQSC